MEESEIVTNITKVKPHCKEMPSTVLTSADLLRESPLSERHREESIWLVLNCRAFAHGHASCYRQSPRIPGCSRAAGGPKEATLVPTARGDWLIIAANDLGTTVRIYASNPLSLASTGARKCINCTSLYHQRRQAELEGDGEAVANC
ncbi:unnamed protein product [Pleuronectes platessa]|uniref:Uncharacterized protein n=1 Tax=Pleuronectes platessa TaxID=8262 RepID=A0A9N7U415_PLEPL|nr:unnamed protein product [Pleuronectes platessa]